VAAAIAATGWWFARPGPVPQPDFRQMTFQRGPVFAALFAPDGQTVIYAAQRGGSRRQIYSNNGVSPEARPLGFEGSLFSISRHGELALYDYGGTMPTSGGMLSKVPMNGGVPVPVERNVMSADWSPDGSHLAISRVTGGRSALEFPPGRPLYTTPGWISSIRFSPRGDRIAFVDHPVRHDDGGTPRLLDIATGKASSLTASWTAIGSLAWHPNGELWFSAAPDGAPSSFWAVRPNGSGLRNIARFPGVARLRDISPNGSVLMSRESRRLESIANFGPGGVRDISWHDWTRAVEVTSGGRILFDESGEAAGGRGVSYLYSARDGGTQRLGDGYAMSLSPDGAHALLLSHVDRTRFRLVPIGGGQPRDVPAIGLEYQWGRFFPDGRHLLVLANHPGESLRLYRVTLDGATPPQAISAPGMVRHAAISADGTRVAWLSGEGKLMLGELGAQPPVEIPVQEPLAPLRFTADGRRIYVQHVRGTSLPVAVSLLDLATGKLSPWRQFAPADTVGIDLLTRILIAPDERTTVFSVRRILSDLYVASGLR
jgi:dipeptidyl aminopeptidase/acylaminoacyl peptidase